MKFMLGEVAGLVSPEKAAEMRSGADIVCPTGKRVFLTKDAALHTGRAVNRRFDQNQTKSAFRCDYCQYFHLGRRR